MSIRNLLRALPALALTLSCTAALATPKAAEHAGGEVTYSELAHPKPATKGAKPAAATPAAGAAKAKANKTAGKGSAASKTSARSRAKSGRK